MGCAYPAEAQNEPAKHRIQWPARYRPFQAGDYVWTGAMLAAYSYLEFGTEVTTHPKWDRPILFDEQANELLHVEDPDVRKRWLRYADVGRVITWVAPWATATIMPLVDRFNWRVAVDLNLINAQAFALTGFLSRVGHVFIGRERPDGTNSASFPAGHAAGSFVGASTSCVHHLVLGLFGHIALDASWCVALSGLAVTVAMGREAAGKHWATDTFGAFLVGVGSGVVIPLVFHYYGAPDHERRSSLRWTLSPAAVGSGIGLRVFAVH